MYECLIHDSKLMQAEDNTSTYARHYYDIEGI